MRNKGKEKKLKSLRKQLKKLQATAEYRQWSYGEDNNTNPNVGGPGGYGGGSRIPMEVLTRAQRIENAIKTLNGGKL